MAHVTSTTQPRRTRAAPSTPAKRQAARSDDAAGTTPVGPELTASLADRGDGRAGRLRRGVVVCPGQHPYKGPTAAGLLVMYGVLACWIATVVTFQRRALSGVSGRSIRQQRAYGAAIVTALVAVSVFQGVLHHDGVSNGIVYGIYPLTAQLIAMGAVAAGLQAAREDWPGFGVAIAVMCVAAGGAFAGPRGVWLGDGIGLAVVILGYSVTQAWLRRQ